MLDIKTGSIRCDQNKYDDLNLIYWAYFILCKCHRVMLPAVHAETLLTANISRPIWHSGKQLTRLSVWHCDRADSEDSKCLSSSWGVGGTAAGVAGQFLVPGFHRLLLTHSPPRPERWCWHACFTLSSTTAAKFNTTSWNSKNIHSQQLVTVVWKGNPGHLLWRPG